MSPSLIVFIASGVGIILLIGVKMLQERLGLLLFWPDARTVGERFLQRQAAKVRVVTNMFTARNMYVFMHYILVKIRGLFVYFQHMIDKRLLHIVNVIKGKRVIDARGKASHFLNDINRFKDKFRRQ
jgi:hypothetical protein